MAGGKSKAVSKKADSKLSVKKGAGAVGKAKRGKAAKDPNKPKRPASAFFVFMEGFRKEFKEKNPHNKSVSVVGKAGGEKWKSMSETEKAPFVEKANKRKKEYEKNMDAYNNNQQAPEEEESDKSRSEVEEAEGIDGSEDEED